MANGRLKTLALLVALAFAGAGSASAQTTMKRGIPPKLTLDEIVAALQGQPVGDRHFEALTIKGYVCDALIAQSPDVCALLKGFAGDSEQVCRMEALKGILIETGGQEGPGLAAACQRAMASTKTVQPGMEGLACEAWGDAVRTGRSALFCDKIGSIVTAHERRSFAEQCPQMMAFLKGPEGCRGARDLACIDYGTLAKAGGNIGLCGTSRLCQAALSHLPAACAAAKEDAVTAFKRSEQLSEAAGPIRQDLELRVEYGLPLADAGKKSIGDLIDKENAYRSAHGLAPFKRGDQFLWTMSGPAREMYLQQLKLRGPSSGSDGE